MQALTVTETLQKELAEIKEELKTIQANKVSRLHDSLFSPELYSHYYKMAEMLSKSNMVPKDDIGKPQNIFIKMSMGYQLGFPVEQAVLDISVINGRPSLWGDGLLALCLSHPLCEYIEEEPLYKDDKVFGYKCTVKRKGHPPRS